ncbi:MAG: acyltransferase family protein, partial [Prosthecobacter sp.]|uniref:acyltransferase family protein n=1 Tax=Prosthecobacter sp. TaxID=1965333 RepID=UPI003BB21436
QFWERRIRRILPALCVVLVFVLVTTWMFYLPEDFKQAGQSLLYQALMAANFYFRGNGDYFAPAAETKPLLHTWSLAVEEQFYLFFPLLLTFLMRSRSSKWKHYILGITLGSFILGSVGAYSSHNYRSAFYLLPFRAWELLVGVLLAIYCPRPQVKRWVSEASGLLGLGLICMTMLAYNDHMHFPGPAALAPCLGAALIIFSSGSSPSIVGRLLSFPPFVFIGLVSYSLYLWHWPLLTLSQYLSAHELSTSSRIQLLLLSFVLAVLSWKLIETPFRRRQWLGERRQIFKFAGITTALFLALASTVWIFNGFPARFPAKALAYASTHMDNQTQDGYKKFHDQAGTFQGNGWNFIEFGSDKVTQPISLLLYGDSHAAAAAPALDLVCREASLRALMPARRATPPAVKNSPTPYQPPSKRAPKVSEDIVDFVAEQHIKHVIFICRWKLYGPLDELRDDLVNSTRALMAAGAQVIVFKGLPEHDSDVPRVAALTVLRKGDFDTLGTSEEQHRKASAPMDEIFAKLTEMGVTVVDPSDLFLNSSGNYRVIQNDKLLYHDNNHLTPAGAELLVPFFRSLVQKF